MEIMILSLVVFFLYILFYKIGKIYGSGARKKVFSLCIKILSHIFFLKTRLYFLLHLVSIQIRMQIIIIVQISSELDFE